MLAFIKTRPELAVPDVEYMFPGSPPYAHMWFPGFKAPYKDAFGIRPAIMHPDSRGKVWLRSADPRERRASCSTAISAPNDLPTLREGFRRGREIAMPETDGRNSAAWNSRPDANVNLTPTSTLISAA